MPNDYTHNGIDYLQLAKVLYAKAVRGDNVGNIHPRIKKSKPANYSKIIFGGCVNRVFECL